MTIYDLIQQWKDRPEDEQRHAVVEAVYTLDFVESVLHALGRRPDALPPDVGVKCLENGLKMCNDILSDRGSVALFYDSLEREVQESLDALDVVENDM